MPDAVKYEPSSANGAIDKVLLRGASSGKSPQELSALTGGTIKPARAAQRVRDILASRDWLTQVERKQLLTEDLMALKDELMRQALDLRQTKDASGPLIKVLALVGKQLDADKLDLESALTQIRKAHAEMMLSAIRLTLERSFHELEKRHTDVSRGELTEIFQLALPDAVQELEARVVEPE